MLTGAPSPVVRLRLASVNLFSGRSLADGRVDTERMLRALADLDADVLALQEVDRFQPRSAGADQSALVAEAIGAVDHRFVPLVLGTPGEPGWRPAPPQLGEPEAGQPEAGPQYGIALLSRRPVRRWEVLHLAPPPGRWPLPVPAGPTGRPRLLWLREEPRAVLAALLHDPPVTLACTHLSFVPGVNGRQLRQAHRWLARLPGPGVLLGDLNLPGQLPSRLTGLRSLVQGATYPAALPRVQLDHILGHRLPAPAADPPGPGVPGGQVVELPFSDHRAVVLDLHLE